LLSLRRTIAHKRAKGYAAEAFHEITDLSQLHWHVDGKHNSWPCWTPPNAKGRIDSLSLGLRFTNRTDTLIQYIGRNHKWDSRHCLVAQSKLKPYCVQGKPHEWDPYHMQRFLRAIKNNPDIKNGDLQFNLRLEELTLHYVIDVVRKNGKEAAALEAAARQKEQQQQQDEEDEVDDDDDEIMDTWSSPPRSVTRTTPSRELASARRIEKNDTKQVTVLRAGDQIAY
jgi:hypothetical protein